MFKNPLSKPEPLPNTQADSIPREMEFSPRHLPKDPQKFKDAVSRAKDAISKGGTKVSAVKLIYPILKDETPEVILLAFTEGCGLTSKGAVTYYYNQIRESKKQKMGK